MPPNDPPTIDASESPSVYADDTSLFDLGTVELFVVTVLRLWVAGYGDAAWRAQWPSAFRAAGIEPGGAPAFGSLMRTIAGAAHRSLDMRATACRRLGRDEGKMLHLVSLLQRDRMVEAVAVLGDWLPPAAVRLAARHASAFAAGLAHAGLVVPLRHAQAAVVSRLTAYAHAAPGLALLQ
jgi:hypothetical protein